MNACGELRWPGVGFDCGNPQTAMRTNSHFAEVSRREIENSATIKRGLRIARSAVPKLKASFNFVPNETENRSEMTLDMLPKNGLARVVAVEFDGSHNLRLMEMGLVPGASIRMVKA